MLYTICATDKKHLAKPCAIIEAFSLYEAQNTIKKLRKSGDLLYVPIGSHLTVRKTSKRENKAFIEFLTKPGALSSIDPDGARRSQDRHKIFNQKLWRGEVNFIDDEDQTKDDVETIEVPSNDFIF